MSIADVSYNVGSTDFRQVDHPFPSSSDLVRELRTDAWEDELGEYELFTILDKNRTKIEYLKLDTSNYQIIMPMSAYNSEVTRKAATKTSYDIRSYSSRSIMHNYNTRSSHKYKNNIGIVLHNVNEDTLDRVIDTISTFYPDISNYYDRGAVSGNQSIIIEPLVNQEESIRFIGSVCSIINILHTGYIYNMLDSLANHVEQKSQPTRITTTEYNNIIGNKIATAANITNDCSICLESIQINDVISVTKCNHTYHEWCLREWLTKECNAPSCPTCRTNLSK